MSTIFCIIFKNQLGIEGDIEETLLESLCYWDPDDEYTWSNNDVFFSNSLLFTTPQSVNESKPNFHKENHCYIISDCRLDYRRELGNDLELNWEVAKDFPDGYLILKAFLKWGEKCVNYIYGDFSFAIWNDSDKVLFCARDHFGIRPLYYSEQRDFFIVCSDFMILKSIPGLIFQLREQFILDSLCNSIPLKNDSGFSNIKKLEPANMLWFREKSNLEIIRYWELKVREEFKNLSEKQAILGVRERFLASLKSKLRSNLVMGMELSGGLDSSSIASCIEKFSLIGNESFYTFTHSYSPEQKVHSGINFTPFTLCKEVYGSSSFTELVNVSDDDSLGCFSSVSGFLKISQRPIIQAYALLSDQLYCEARKRGVGILLSGYGGDEGVTFKGSSYPYEIANQRDWDKLKKVLLGITKRRSYKYYWLFAKYYVWKQFPSFINFIRKYNPLKKDFYKHRAKILAIDKSLKREVDIIGRYKDRGMITESININERQSRRISAGNLSDRLENSYYMARNQKIEYRYPFLDVKLIEYYFSLKSEYKYKNGTKRYLFREAMEGILDDRIRLNSGIFGATIPNVSHRISLDRSKIKDIINEGRKNNKYHYVDYDHLANYLNRIDDSKPKKGLKFNPKVFFSSFSVLILQKWQREGKIDIGIKC